MTQFISASCRVAVAAILAALTLSPAVLAEDYASTCRYFSNQAFQDRHMNVGSTLPMQLAQDCVDARIYIQSPNIEVRTRAETYLNQLDAYRTAIAALMVARTRNDRQSPTIGAHRLSVGRANAAISATGLYLIAREMGVIETHGTWTTWRRSLALSDPRFRID